ncbi:probable calcium-binding protein cml23 [Phtheirospermum japonicum]|uniref:Probable calcium-binding protein cml23 n=1 Tax=Phtheirospermum japonicum TaxID=374723 RepID=A0A830B7I8_9LAMI|nr:probable calcium-binding protein cml23 [Phtheirospermum japonicum]
MSELVKGSDGFIDSKEFMAFHCGGGGDNNKELKETFDLYDLDKSGKISASELHSAMRGLGEKCSIKISSIDVEKDDD